MDINKTYDSFNQLLKSKVTDLIYCRTIVEEILAYILGYIRDSFPIMTLGTGPIYEYIDHSIYLIRRYKYSVCTLLSNNKPLQLIDNILILLYIVMCDIEFTYFITEKYHFISTKTYYIIGNNYIFTFFVVNATILK